MNISLDVQVTARIQDYMSIHTPPKNGVIALWPNTGVEKFKYYVSEKQNGFNNKIHWYRPGFNGLKHVYSVISVIVDLLPGNTKNRQSTRSWTARVRVFHPWAALSTVCCRVLLECTQIQCAIQKLITLPFKRDMWIDRVLAMKSTGWRRCERCLHLYRSFFAKEPYN